MAVAAGQLNRLVNFQRRAPMPTTPGTLRSAFASLGAPEWALFTEGRPTSGASNGTLPEMQIRTGSLTVRDSSFTKTIGQGDRVVIDGRAFDITSVQAPARATGDIVFGLVEGPSRAGYEVEFNRRGEAVTVRRAVASAPAIQVVARAIVKGYAPDELVAGIMQGDRKVLLCPTDLETGGFPLPLREGAGDALIVRGRMMTIQAIDDSTHRSAGVLNAYELRVRG